MADLLEIITSDEPKQRNVPLEVACRGLDAAALLGECDRLDAFRRSSDNLYHRVRALLFLYAIHRFHLPAALKGERPSRIPFDGYQRLLRRRFEEAIDIFLTALSSEGPSDGISSALALAYRELAFATLANQVRRSVRSVRGNQWMFRMGHPADQPLRIRSDLLKRTPGGPYPILSEYTPVRMDLSHSAWSDIFFLGMDFPEGARVLNVSIDLAIRGRDTAPRPPIETYLRVIDEPVLRLVSVDLGTSTTISNLSDVFNFASDYLGLLKAAIIAAGIVPAGLEGSEENLADLLAVMVGPGLGLEVVSSVNNIPKGSRLAVSTNLLASLISLCMRATGQARALEGTLSEGERRLVAARAILGEWLGGSGGGWQDSGGIWPAMKLITGTRATEGDPEFGISRGRLLPNHRILDESDASDAARSALQASLVLVHGGMAQNVGPILEMVTEKYLLRSEREWAARQDAMRVLDGILAALRDGDVRQIGSSTTRNFMGPIQSIIPAASNLFTETVIARTKEYLGSDFWGFWMLGGMSGGGMGFIVAPDRRSDAQDFLQRTMGEAKQEFEHALPFAMDPVVYDFGINARGTDARLLSHDDAMMPAAYYALMVPGWLRADARSLNPGARLELERFGAACRQRGSTHDRIAMGDMARTLFDRLIPSGIREQAGDARLEDLLQAHGFDGEQHEQIRAAMKSGRIGLAQNRLPASISIEDVSPEDVLDADREGAAEDCMRAGRDALAVGSVAVVTLAAGAGSRWTQGAGVVKALHPFCKLAGRHRSFLELHLAKSHRTSRKHGAEMPHIVTTSYLTHGPISRFLASETCRGHAGPILLSEGKSVGLRLIPMVRDLRFAWEEMPQQLLDEQAQKVRDSLRAALVHWAESAGQGSDYTDNIPIQCLHPVGHWYEVPNLLRNGTLASLLKMRPGLKHLLLHNVDTLGTDVDPALLGLHINRGACLTFEVITRRIEDRGGGLARADGRPRLLEGLAMPREEDEFRLSYYNTMTTWIAIDPLLAAFGLSRSDIDDPAKVSSAIRDVALRIPTYITIKDVKKRWGHGQEDVFPVAQFEKLWSDMTALREIQCAFVAVPRKRGQQMKELAQLDGWLRDGSREYVESLCEWIS